MRLSTRVLEAIAQHGRQLESLRLRGLTMAHPAAATLPLALPVLNNLTALTVNNCNKLQALPFGLALRLQRLALLDNAALMQLPSLNPCTALQSLRLVNSPKLCLDGEWLGDASQLSRLEMRGCAPGGAWQLPVGAESALLSLRLDGAAAAAIPAAGWHGAALLQFDLRDASLPLALHSGLDRLGSLTNLHLRRVEGLETLPRGLAPLTALCHVEMEDCADVRGVPAGMQHLTELTAVCIRRLHRFAWVAAVPTYLASPSLQTLTLYNLPITALPACGGLAALRQLDIGYCQQLSSLQPLGMALQQLELRGCYRLSRLPTTLRQSSQLQRLTLSHCSSLEAFPNEVCWPQLTHLDLSGCGQLTALTQPLTRLTALQELLLDGCHSLRAWPPGLSDLPSLRRLVLGYTTLMQTINSGVALPPNLRELRAYGLSDATRRRLAGLGIRWSCP